MAYLFCVLILRLLYLKLHVLDNEAHLGDEDGTYCQ